MSSTVLVVRATSLQIVLKSLNQRKTWCIISYPSHLAFVPPLSVPQDFHGCTQPFFIYAQNIMVYNLAAHNYVSLKDNPNEVYIKLKGIGCTI